MAARGKGQQLEVHSSRSRHWSSSAFRWQLAAITQAPSLLGSLTSLNFAPSPASVPDRQPQFFSSQYTALLAQQSHFTTAIVSAPCSRCPCSRGASTRTAPRAGRVVVEWRSGRGSRRGRRVDPRLGLTLGSRPSILPIATRDIACRLWNASDLILHLSSRPAGCYLLRVRLLFSNLRTAYDHRQPPCHPLRARTPPAADSSSNRIEPPTYRPSFQHASLRWDKVGAAQAGSPVCPYS